MTFTDFERLPNPPSGHYELHDGQLIIVTPRTKSQMQVRQALFDSLSGLRGRGFITVAFSFRPALDEYRQLDIGFVVADRWAKDKAEYFTGAAEFAVSLDDWIGETQNACLDHGGPSSGPWILSVKRPRSRRRIGRRSRMIGLRWCRSRSRSAAISRWRRVLIGSQRDNPPDPVSAHPACAEIPH